MYSTGTKVNAIHLGGELSEIAIYHIRQMATSPLNVTWK
jgi:hypothetical protein